MAPAGSAAAGGERRVGQNDYISVVPAGGRVASGRITRGHSSLILSPPLDDVAWSPAALVKRPPEVFAENADMII